MKKKNDKVTIREVYALIKELRTDIKDGFVTRDEFRPVKAIAFGMVAIIMLAVFTAILAGVVNVARANL